MRDFGFLPRYNEIFALQRCYAVKVGSYRRFGTTYCSHIRQALQRAFLDCLTLEYAKDGLYRNVGN